MTGCTLVYFCFDLFYYQQAKRCKLISQVVSKSIDLFIQLDFPRVQQNLYFLCLFGSSRERPDPPVYIVRIFITETRDLGLLLYNSTPAKFLSQFHLVLKTLTRNKTQTAQGYIVRVRLYAIDSNK